MFGRELSSKNAQPARGTRDILPQDVQLRAWAISTILDVYKSHGFLQVETPIIEDIEWLTGGVGGENEKLLFKILKRGEKLEAASQDTLSDLALRFDLTVPLTRYFSNNQTLLPMPFKAIQIGPVFRAERPQKGRFRQFMQCDIDIFGDDSVLSEIELIAASTKALTALSLSGFEVKINDRRALVAMATHLGFTQSKTEEFFVVLDKLDKIGIDGVTKELSTKGFDAGALARLAEMLNHLAEGEDPVGLFREIGVDAHVIAELNEIIAISRELSDGAFSVSLDPSVVRGMGYYTGPVFEITIPGWNSSIAGGGRYDTMLERYGRSAPAVGISLGFERILSILAERPDATLVARRYVTVLFSQDQGIKKAYEQAGVLRDAGFDVSLRYRSDRLGRQLKRLETEANLMRRTGDFYGVLILGEDSEPRAL